MLYYKRIIHTDSILHRPLILLFNDDTMTLVKNRGGIRRTSRLFRQLLHYKVRKLGHCERPTSVFTDFSGLTPYVTSLWNNLPF